ncbi:MAG: PEP-CTERM sorting domain-containing protein [Candidatus Marinimicrobia bacterium]|nr:PEP-CTERM sorting domain-containing protein [Candidatus Neomarinimicrobiota bacterium]
MSRICRVVCGLVVVIMAASVAGASLIAEHTGAQDPIAAGNLGHIDDTYGTDSTAWVPLYSAYPPVSTIAGPDTSGAVDAWWLTGTYRAYNYIPTAADYTALEAGFKVSVNVRIPTADVPLDFQPVVEYAGNNLRYYIVFGSNASGEQMIQVNTANTAGSYTVSGGTINDFALTELVYDPVAGNADLFVNGTERISNINPISSTLKRFYWGSNAPGASGAGHFNLVSLEVVPEPTSFILVLLAGGLMLARRRSKL